jgi:hypothetical protein
MKLAGYFDPGILVAASPGQFGIKIPIGVEMGIPSTRRSCSTARSISRSFFTFGDFNAFYVPLLFGGGISTCSSHTSRSLESSR